MVIYVVTIFKLYIFLSWIFHLWSAVNLHNFVCGLISHSRIFQRLGLILDIFIRAFSFSVAYVRTEEKFLKGWWFAFRMGEAARSVNSGQGSTTFKHSLCHIPKVKLCTYKMIKNLFRSSKQYASENVDTSWFNEQNSSSFSEGIDWTSTLRPAVLTNIFRFPHCLIKCRDGTVRHASVLYNWQ
jgi:hypothetical protein